MNTRSLLLLPVIAAGLLLQSATADGPLLVGGDYEITAYTVEAAGGRLTGGNYALHASLGQLDAHGQVTGGAWGLEGGFWPGGKGPGDTVFKDGFE